MRASDELRDQVAHCRRDAMTREAVAEISVDQRDRATLCVERRRSTGDEISVISRNYAQKTANCGLLRIVEEVEEPRVFQGFRRRSRLSTARLKIVVSPVRVQVSPSAIPHSGRISFFG